jgi:hypothetical protein
MPCEAIPAGAGVRWSPKGVCSGAKPGPHGCVVALDRPWFGMRPILCIFCGGVRRGRKPVVCSVGAYMRQHDILGFPA